MTPAAENVHQWRATWLETTGPAPDVVIATRARLARNLPGFAFPHHARAVELETIRTDLLVRLRRLPAFRDGWSLACAELDDVRRRVLAEKMLAPARLIANPGECGLVVAPELALTAVINAEDHLRLHAFQAGFAPEAALAGVLALDDQLENEVEVAFSPEWGYLTASPTNLGTGLRLSALLHLPGLVLCGEIEKVLNAMRQLQFGVRGAYGEGGSVRGAMFEVANLVTLGRDEQEVAADFAVHVGKIVTYERSAREQMRSRDPLGLEDMVHRSHAVLANARVVTSQETFDCLSQVRFGIHLGLLPPLDVGLLNRVTVEQQAGHLAAAAGRPLSGRDKGAARANLLRAVFCHPGGMGA